MATAIEWTDETWNPVVGCTKVSQGCKNCYAKTLHDLRHKASLRGKRVHPQYARPFETIQLMPDRLETPLHWRTPRRVFVNSVSDLFHEHIPDAYIVLVFQIMGQTPRHTYQILTKRPERMKEWIDRFRPTPLPNAWLGVSVENQDAADERIPLLLQTPAAVRFLSCEPLLGPVDIRSSLAPAMRVTRAPSDIPPSERQPLTADDVRALNQVGRAAASMYGGVFVDWVIVGGESGPKARECDLSWIQSIVAQCKDTGVPCFVKQLGKWVVGDNDRFVVDRWQMADGSIFVPPIIGDGARKRPTGAMAFGLCDQKGGNPSEWPEDLRVREFPHAAAVPA